jgi:integrase/recombinase XerD
MLITSCIIVLIQMNYNKIGNQMRHQGQAKITKERDRKRIIQYQNGNGRTGKRNIALLMFSHLCGTRSKEMAELSIGDVYSIKEGIIYDEALLTREMTKGDKQRTIFLKHPKLKESLIKYIKDREDRGEVLENDAPLFRSERNVRFTGQTLSVVFRRMYDSVGLKQMSSHSGRRTYATSLDEQGVGIKNIQQLMGHSNLSTTSIYIDNNPIRLAEINKNLKLV